MFSHVFPCLLLIGLARPLLAPQFHIIHWSISRTWLNQRWESSKLVRRLQPNFACTSRYRAVPDTAAATSARFSSSAASRSSMPSSVEKVSASKQSLPIQLRVTMQGLKRKHLALSVSTNSINSGGSSSSSSGAGGDKTCADKLLC